MSPTSANIRSDREKNRPISTILIGAGRVGHRFVNEASKLQEGTYEIIGFVDDDPDKLGETICGFKVLGAVADLPLLVQNLNAELLIISICKISQAEMAIILAICEGMGLPHLIVPASFEMIGTTTELTDVHDIRIEDILGRESAQVDTESIGRCLFGKSVMVTGAGGSIGAELVRQVSLYLPSKVVLVERSEYGLFSIHSEMVRREPSVPVLSVPVLADAGDPFRMKAVFEEHKPQVVIHAAAHKHVPLGELNVAEVVKNNVIATNILGSLSGEFGVESFVLISTDKAVRPASIMGASKRLAEIVVHDLNSRFTSTKFFAIRFGNVVGSTGSVIPIFEEQIRSGGPVTVTDREMERYFLPVQEAAALVLQAITMGNGSEIFTLKMGAPVRIYELAREMIRRSGCEIPVQFIGPRPGEKILEDLVTAGDRLAVTSHPRILVSQNGSSPDVNASEILERMETMLQSGSAEEIRRYLNDVIPEANLSGGKQIAATGI